MSLRVGRAADALRDHGCTEPSCVPGFSPDLWYSDPDGSYHYQLFRLYQKLGNEPAARTALKKYNEIREARAVSVSAMEDYSEPGDRQQARKAVGHILEK